MEIEKYTKQELGDIATILKRFRSLRKNVGKKSSLMIHQELSGEKTMRVEYFSSLDPISVVQLTKTIYKDVFSVEADESKLIWKENPLLSGGMRIFFADDMIDLSYESIRNQVRRI